MQEELAAAGCPLLVIVVSPAICATIIAKFGTEAQKQRWLPALRHRRAQDGLRHHRARRRVQLAQPVAHRHQGRRHLPAQRLEVLHLRGRRVRGHPGGHPVGRRPRHRPGPALPLRGGHRHPGTRQAGAAGRDHRPGEAVHPVLRQRPGGGGPADRRRGRGPAPGVLRAQPRAHPVGRHRQRHRALRPGQGGRVRQEPRGVGHARSAATRGSPTRWPRPRSRSSWPG